MVKAKTTEIHYKVTGYFKHRWVETPVIRVVVSGTYEGRTLKGLCLIDDHPTTWRESVELTGDGRYSFMIGGNSLRNSDAVSLTIKKASKAAAEAWQAANPKALHEFHVAQAALRLERANTQELQAVNDLNIATKERQDAASALAALQAKS